MSGLDIAYIVCGLFFAGVYLGFRDDALDSYGKESNRNKLLWRFPGLTSLCLIFGWFFVVIGCAMWVIWLYIRLLGRETIAILNALRKE